MFLIAPLGCADPDEAAPRDDTAAQTREFSAEDKRVASLLSIGDSAALEESEGPYEQARMCRDSINAMIVRFRSLDALDASQVRAMETARELFQSRMDAAIETARPGDAAQEDELAELPDDQQAARQARIAIACVRTLEG
ncbi:hypothetical protein ELI_13400 [Erythrobacter litoralis HTCC2594]|uniref:Uncharacterized protein n=1 Tax=Erythrobacter litoralis (strain HTCC2594) TaxID=314225 RepID=Q2N6B9_ERYLH|nr:hypothetical protein ELI_13400 [Erythrobacter litoralis HTCC2594]